MLRNAMHKAVSTAWICKVQRVPSFSFGKVAPSSVFPSAGLRVCVFSRYKRWAVEIQRGRGESSGGKSYNWKCKMKSKEKWVYHFNGAEFI